MLKISVVVPVYNTEKYLKRCVDSILNQKMKDYELIIVNDGSQDNSEEIIKKYEQQYSNIIKYYKKENGGLSDARNYGVAKATGKYICFIDSDDYIAEDLFEKLEKYIEQDVDLIKYKCIRVNEQNEIIEKVTGPVFDKKSGQEAFNELYSSDVLMETAWLYLYKAKYYKENNYEFPIKKYHEDWAIVPYIVLNAESIISTDIYGYYYVQTSSSITRNNNDEKIFQRSKDMLEHYDNIMKKIDNKQGLAYDNYKIYMTNCLILKLNELPQKYHKEYITEIKKRKIIGNLKIRDCKQLIKKLILKINIKLYLKLQQK